MTNYKNCTCSVCNQPLRDGDDIVVCPECGAPYHRACYAKEGHCVFESQHGTGFEYRRPSTAGSGNRCPNCGADNPQGNLFCENCGTSLTEAATEPAQGTAGEPRRVQPVQQPAGSYSDPQQQVQALFEAATVGRQYDGISSADWAQYIGKSAPYYLFQFARMDESGRKTGICWSALFLGPLYFAYRKMWGWAAAAVLGVLVVNIPSFLDILQTLGVNIGFTVSTGALNTMMMVCMVLSWAMSIFFGMFAFHLYRQHAAKKMQGLKATALDDSEYRASLQKHGGPSVVGVVVLVVAFVLFSYAFAFWVGPENILKLYGMYY